MLTPTLVSIQVGRPQPLGHVMSAFRKQPVAGPVRLQLTNLEGDEQADRRGHGGPEQAVLCYADAHYESWLRELGVDMRPGGFGENFTVAGADEWSVCIDDVYEVGTALVQVSKPRGPCFKIGLRWHMPRLLKLVHETGRHGWYLRVLREGVVEAGQEMRLVERPLPGLTVRAGAALERVRARG
jgi:MOSC domain-containing protein YiiM